MIIEKGYERVKCCEVHWTKSCHFDQKSSTQTVVVPRQHRGTRPKRPQSGHTLEVCQQVRANTSIQGSAVTASGAPLFVELGNPQARTRWQHQHSLPPPHLRTFGSVHMMPICQSRLDQRAMLSSSFVVSGASNKARMRMMSQPQLASRDRGKVFDGKKNSQLSCLSFLGFTSCCFASSETAHSLHLVQFRRAILQTGDNIFQ